MVKALGIKPKSGLLLDSVEKFIWTLLTVPNTKTSVDNNQKGPYRSGLWSVISKKLLLYGNKDRTILSLMI